jgi:O-antigen/teichoic acid export membrane protein
LQSTDSYFIKLLTNSGEQIGLFSLGLTIASSIYMFTSAFQQIWPSYIFNAYTTMEEARFKKIFAFFFELYTVVYLFLQLNLTFFSYNIVALFSSNPAFQPAYQVVGLISLNTIIYSYLSFTAMGMSIKKVSAPLGIALTLSALAGVGLNFLLIPPFGFVGSALATVLASAPVPVYVYLRSQKLYAFNIPSSKIIMSTLLAFLVVCVVIFYPTLLNDNWHDIFLKLGISLCCGAFLVGLYYKPVKNMLPVLSPAAHNRSESGQVAASAEENMAIQESKG